MTETVGGVVSGLWLSPEKNLCLQSPYQPFKSFDPAPLPNTSGKQKPLQLGNGARSTYWTMALNISGKEKS